MSAVRSEVQDGSSIPLATDSRDSTAADDYVMHGGLGTVKDALVTGYKIAPNRLATTGYGASSPVESNATLEGRARNRRVELRRQ